MLTYLPTYRYHCINFNYSSRQYSSVIIHTFDTQVPICEYLKCVLCYVFREGAWSPGRRGPWPTEYATAVGKARVVNECDDDVTAVSGGN